MSKWPKRFQTTANLATSLALLFLLVQMTIDSRLRSRTARIDQLDNTLELVRQFSDLEDTHGPLSAIYNRWEKSIIDRIKKGEWLDGELASQILRETLTGEAITFRTELIRLIVKAEEYRKKGLLEEQLFFDSVSAVLDGTDIYDVTKEVAERDVIIPPQPEHPKDISIKEIIIIRDLLKIKEKGIDIDFQKSGKSTPIDDRIANKYPDLAEKIIKFNRYQESLRRHLLLTTRKPKRKKLQATFLMYELHLKSFQIWFLKMESAK